MEVLMCVVLLALGGNSPVLPVAQVGPWVSVVETCPLLMTPEECGRHLATLERLPPGMARQNYLAMHQALMLDREQACRCLVDDVLPQTASINR